MANLSVLNSLEGASLDEDEIDITILDNDEDTTLPPTDPGSEPIIYDGNLSSDNIMYDRIAISGTQLDSGIDGIGETVTPPGGGGKDSIKPPGEPYEFCYPNPAMLDGKMICEIRT